LRLGTLLKLLLASLVVGIVLTWLDVEPTDLVAQARAAFAGAVAFVRAGVDDLGATASDLVGYTLVGAVIVVPVWLLSLLIRRLRQRR
jgi:hypothetical protein